MTTALAEALGDADLLAGLDLSRKERSLCTLAAAYRAEHEAWIAEHEAWADVVIQREEALARSEMLERHYDELRHFPQDYKAYRAMLARHEAERKGAK